MKKERSVKDGTDILMTSSVADHRRVLEDERNESEADEDKNEEPLSIEEVRTTLRSLEWTIYQLSY